MAADEPSLSDKLTNLTQAQFYGQGVRQSLEAWRAIKSAATRGKLARLRARPRLLCVGFVLGDLELDGALVSDAFPVEVEFRNFDSYEAMLASGVRPDLALFRSHQFWLIDGSYDMNAMPAAARMFPDCVSLIWLWDHHHDF